MRYVKSSNGQWGSTLSRESSSIALFEKKWREISENMVSSDHRSAEKELNSLYLSVGIDAPIFVWVASVEEAVKAIRNLSKRESVLEKLQSARLNMGTKITQMINDYDPMFQPNYEFDWLGLWGRNGQKFQSLPHELKYEVEILEASSLAWYDYWLSEFSETDDLTGDVETFKIYINLAKATRWYFPYAGVCIMVERELAQLKFKELASMDASQLSLVGKEISYEDALEISQKAITVGNQEFFSSLADAWPSIQAEVFPNKNHGLICSVTGPTSFYTFF